MNPQGPLNHPEFTPQPPSDEVEPFRDVFGLKELESMLQEEAISKSELIASIKLELKEPKPHVDDIEACVEWENKMAYLNDMAQRLLGGSTQLLSLQEQIRQRVQET